MESFLNSRSCRLTHSWFSINLSCQKQAVFVPKNGFKMRKMIPEGLGSLSVGASGLVGRT
jgi:hypothetical protein